MIEGPWRGDQIHQRVREVTARYQQADEHDRLSLWLQHRDLRPLLTRLEKHQQD